MYLHKFRIKRFRSIKEMDITFNKGINIIIGENNSGKSSIIDALRICLSFGKQWRDIGIRNDEDFHVDITNVDAGYEPIEFDLTFEIESAEDRALFASLIWQDPANPNYQNLQMHFRYEIAENASGVKRLKWKSWGGGMEGQSIDSNEAQLLYYTYLAPLRNAEQELKPYSKENKISSLFRDLTKYQVTNEIGDIISKNLDADAKKLLAAKLDEVVNQEDWMGIIETGTKFVNEHLDKADIRRKGSSIHLRLSEYKYDNIVKGIVTRKPVFEAAQLADGNEGKQRYFDVSQNGLGENNLIFADAVLGDLKNRRAEKKEHYYSLLIEEPEAHLHPQKQATFFQYLNTLRDWGTQIFITSHSPTLTAKSDLDNIIVIQQQRERHPFTIKNSELSKDNKSHLRKFLDVTKSQLFFSNGTILVEGISEALLLPSFANIIGDQYDLNRNGIEVVNINGVAFEPFAKLYNSADVTKRLGSRCCIITDDDRGMISAAQLINEDVQIGKADANRIISALKELSIVDSSNRIIVENVLEIEINGLTAPQLVFLRATLDERRQLLSSRAANAITLISGNLSARLAVYSFEYELMVASEWNYKIMMFIYKKRMHPRTVFLTPDQPIKQRALEFLEKLDANKDKSEFASQLAQFLDGRERKTKFKVPDYIIEAIQFVIPE